MKKTTKRKIKVIWLSFCIYLLLGLTIITLLNIAYGSIDIWVKAFIYVIALSPADAISEKLIKKDD